MILFSHSDVCFVSIQLLVVIIQFSHLRIMDCNGRGLLPRLLVSIISVVVVRDYSNMIQMQILGKHSHSMFRLTQLLLHRPKADLYAWVITKRLGPRSMMARILRRRLQPERVSRVLVWLVVAVFLLEFLRLLMVGLIIRPRDVLNRN